MIERSRLPSLNGLRAFEAAARHLSLTLAAEELHVTPAAVSHQVAGLEDYLGVQLFERLNRSLRLTDAGCACLPLISEGFDRLADGVNRLQGLDQRGKLKLFVAPSFAGKWLVPRLDHFSANHLELDVEIVAGYGLPDFRSDGTDLAIHYGDGHYPDHYSEQLFSVSAIPVCSPALLRGKHPLRKPDDLHQHRLLHDETLLHDVDRMSWSSWAKFAGVNDLDTARGARFSHTSLTLEAAIEAQGVALTIDKLAAPEIKAGRLIVPFDVKIPLSSGYYLVGLKQTLKRAKVAAFRDWIYAEAALDESRDATTGSASASTP